MDARKLRMSPLLRPEVKKLWMDALRSGRYSQGREALRRDDQFCCLGVLCDLYREFHPTTRWIPHTSVYLAGDSLPGLKYTFLDCKSLLPNAVYQWATGVVVEHALSEVSPAAPAEIVEKHLFQAGFLMPPFSMTRHDGAHAHEFSYLNDNGVPFHVIASIIEEAL